MNRQSIKQMLIRAVDGREVMTATEFAAAWGYTRDYAKRIYLNGIQQIRGKYLIDDIADRLAEEIT